MRTRIIFVALSVALLGLVAWAAFKDSNARSYITAQQQYLKDYPTSDFNVQVQQLFPSFPQATIEGDTYRVERCISCHVPDIGTIGPVEAAKRLSQDFFKYEPNAKQLAAEYHLTGIHPAYIRPTGGNYPPSMSYQQYGPDGFTSFTYTPYTAPGAAPAAPVTVQQPGPLPAFVNPCTDYGLTSAPATGNARHRPDRLHRLPQRQPPRPRRDRRASEPDHQPRVLVHRGRPALLRELRALPWRTGRGRRRSAPEQPGPSRLLQRGLLLPLHRVRLHRLRARRQHHAQLGRDRQRLEPAAEPTWARRRAQHFTGADAGADQHPHPVHPPLGGLQHPPMRTSE